MDFTLSPDQEALQEAVRKLCEGRFPMDRVGPLADAGGVDRELWRELADAGVFSMRLDEKHGGAGLGMAEAVLVFEELGRALVPGPLVWTHLAAGLVPGAADGDRVVGGLHRHRQVEPLLVEHPTPSTSSSPSTTTGCGRWTGAGSRPGPFRGRSTRSRRSTSPVACSAASGGGAGGGGALASGGSGADGSLPARHRRRRHRAVGRLRQGARAVRPSDRLVPGDQAPAGRHARAHRGGAPAVYAAAVTPSTNRRWGRRPERCRGAKLLAGEAATLNAKSATQIHGGMGFTWEVDVHLYLKRAWVLDSVFGAGDTTPTRWRTCSPTRTHFRACL